MLTPLFGPIPGGMEIMVLMLLVVVGAPIAYLISSDGSTARKAGHAAGPGQSTATGDGTTVEIPVEERYRLQKVAQKSIPVTMLFSLIAPLGYLIVKKPWWAFLSFITGNFFILGGLVIPFHTRKIIKDARRELAAAGIEW